MATTCDRGRLSLIATIRQEVLGVNGGQRTGRTSAALRSDDTEAIGSANRLPVDGDKHSDRIVGEWENAHRQFIR